MNFYENIENYIDNELRGQDLAQMEAAIEEDEDLKQEYRFRKEVNEALKEEDVMNLRAKLQNISGVESQTRPAVMEWVKRSKVAVAAASLAFLVGLGGIGYHYLNAPETTGEIFHKYYEPYETTITFRSADTELNLLLTEAYEMYQKENYTQALELFRQVMDKREDMAARLYSGISYMEIEKYQKASKSFRSVIEDENNLFLEQAKWYMSMCHLKIGDVSKARNLLAELSQESRFYDERAKEVLKKLKRVKIE